MGFESWGEFGIHNLRELVVFNRIRAFFAHRSADFLGDGVRKSSLSPSGQALTLVWLDTKVLFENKLEELRKLTSGAKCNILVIIWWLLLSTCI